MGFGSVYSMLMSKPNSEYALLLQSVKTIYCRNVRQHICLFMHFVIQKHIFISLN